MKRIIRLISIIVPCIVIASSCSTMRTEKGIDSVSTLVDNQPYQIRVRSGHSVMDRIIYESASIEFGRYLSISKTDSYRGIIEIIFAGTQDSSFLDATTDFATSAVGGDAWYTGKGYIGLSGSNPTLETGDTSVSTDRPEKRTMRVHIKGAHAERLWTADYKYKGDLTASSLSPDTEEKAAKISIRKIAEKLKDDFPTIAE